MAHTLLDGPQILKTVYDSENKAIKVSGSFELEGFRYFHIGCNSNNLVKSGPGILSSVIVNKVGNLSNIATIYDGTDITGNVIAILDTSLSGSFKYMISFNTGLYIAVSNGHCGDLTVSYA